MCSSDLVNPFVLAVGGEHDGTADRENGGVVPGANTNTVAEGAELVEDSLDELELSDVCQRPALHITAPSPRDR